MKPSETTPALPKDTTAPGTDYTLLVRRIEKAVLENPENARVREVLARQAVWRQLPVPQALEWASLAQVAGLPDTALEIYGFLTENDPDNAGIWEPYIRLLDILDYRKRLSSAAALAGRYLSREQVSAWISGKPESADSSRRMDPDLDAAESPFARMHAWQALLDRFMDLFAGRDDVFARQWADKNEGKSGYVPVRRSMDKADLEEHLKGLKTYGIYLMAPDATVRCGIIDADLVKPLRTTPRKPADQARIKKEQVYMITRIRESSQAMGLTPLLEVSGGKGFHFWYFTNRPVAASLMRAALAGLVDPLRKDLSCFELEVFPKQDQLTGKGFGNLVKLPLGVHRLSGKRSYFPECIKKEIPLQLAFLEKVEKADSQKFASGPKTAAASKLMTHPNLEALTKEYPGLFELQRLCPPLGQLIALAREGRGLRVREEKILFQTLGFLPDGKKILHYLFRNDPEYNPHMVDYKLSRLRGTPLGCKRIHSLTAAAVDFCDIQPDHTGYIHPLIQVEAWQKMDEKKTPVSGKVQNLAQAVENLKIAIRQVERFLA